VPRPRLKHGVALRLRQSILHQSLRWAVSPARQKGQPRGCPEL